VTERKRDVRCESALIPTLTMVLIQNYAVNKYQNLARILWDTFVSR